MAIQAGVYELGPGNASLHVETGRSGTAARAGHDLLVDVRVWAATLAVGDDSSLRLTVDPTSLHVREGKGGLQALSNDDKADIGRTIDQEILKRRVISFTSSSVERSGSGLAVSGELELGGETHPLSFELSESGGSLTGSATIQQSDWSITPYSALFGALKVNDDVRVVVEAKLG